MNERQLHFNPVAEMEKGRAAWRAGEFESAMQHLLYCWDHGCEHSRDFFVLKLSFLPLYMGDVAKKYPPMKTHITSRRDQLLEDVKTGNSDVLAAKYLRVLDSVVQTGTIPSASGQ